MKWSKLRKNEKQLLVIVTPLLLIIMISLVIAYTVNSLVGTFVGFNLTISWIIGSFIFITIDSKSRWPEASVFQRFANVVTFKR